MSLCGVMTQPVPITEEKYEEIRGILQEKISIKREKIIQGAGKRTLRRDIVLGEDRHLEVNCPAWVVAVIFDDLPLFEELTKQEVHLPSQQSFKMFLYEDTGSDRSRWAHTYMNYDMVWYCASKNRSVTEELLLQKLEAYGGADQKPEKRGVLQNLLRLADGYLKAPGRLIKKDRKKQKERVDYLWEHAPGLAKKIVENMGGIDILFGFEMEELLLWEKLLREEADQKNAQDHAFRWYKSFCMGVNHIHFSQPDLWFKNAEEMLQSFRHFMGLILSFKKEMSTGFFELLLMQWEDFLYTRTRERNDDKALQNVVEWNKVIEQNTMITEKCWKNLDGAFRRLIVTYYEAHPDCVENMVRKGKFFPSVPVLRFLSCEVCHKPVPVTIRFLEKRSWYMDSPFWDPYFDQKKKEEDLQIFQWVRVEKREKRFSKLEKYFLQHVSEDVVRAAGMAGVFSLDYMDRYIDFSRRFGRIELIPVLLSMRAEMEDRALEK